MPRRLQSKLTVLFLLLPSVAVALVCTYAVLSHQVGQRRALIQEADVILTILVHHVPVRDGAPRDRTDDIHVWRVLVEQLPQYLPRVRYAVLVDSAGRDILSGLRPANNPPISRPGAPVVVPGLFHPGATRPVVHASARLPGREEAYVQIGLEAGPGWASLALLQIHVAAMLAVTLAVNLGLVRRALRRLIGPIERLHEQSRVLAEGGMGQPVPVEGPEEVAQLSATFNTMLARRHEDAERIRVTLDDLEQERRRLLTIVESLQSGVVLLEPDGKIAYANSQICRFLGQDQQSLIDRTVSPILLTAKPSPEQLVEHLFGPAAWAAATADREIELAVVPVGDADGQSLGQLLLVRDRTHERRLQRQLAEQEKIATVGLLAAGIAHEVNNPLDGLQNCLRRIVQDPTNTEQIERYAGLMTASLCHIETVIKQLLNLSHKQDRRIRRILINDVLVEAVNMARVGRRWKNIEVTWRLDRTLPPIPADAQHMTQIFLNLILNAVAAMPDGGRLTLTTVRGRLQPESANDEAVVAEVTDTGRGIPPELLPRLFEPFFTTRNGKGGTGLGLTVAHSLVIEHGGELEAESTPGTGTTFRVRLPCPFLARPAAARRAPERTV